MWSIANEPVPVRKVHGNISRHWRKQRVNRPDASDHLRQCNVLRRSHRYISDLFDVLCLNRYYGWYVQTAIWKRQRRYWKKNFWPGRRTASADYHHRIRRGYVSRAALMYTDMWSEEYQCAWLDMYHPSLIASAPSSVNRYGISPILDLARHIARWR